MLKILQASLQQYVNHEIPDVQAGFRKDRGARDQIANICWIIEKAREFQKNIYFCFIDYAKVFVWITINCGKFKRLEYQTTWWAWVWINSGSWWWTGKPGVLKSMGSQSWTWMSNWTGLSDWIGLNWISYKFITRYASNIKICYFCFSPTTYNSIFCHREKYIMTLLWFVCFQPNTHYETCFINFIASLATKVKKNAI